MNFSRWMRSPRLLPCGVGLLVHGVALFLLLTGRAVPAALVALCGVAVMEILFGYAQARAVRRVAALASELGEARTDPVTGLAVRAVAERHVIDAAGTELTVALVDVDDLHAINHAHGHHGGDWFLAVVAERLSDAAVPGDLVARLGGDEFVVLTVRDPHPLAVARPWRSSGRPPSVTACCRSR